MGRKKLDFDPEKREQIIFHRHYDPEIYRAGYGICKFDKLPYHVIKELLDNGFITNHYYLDTPDVEEFVKYVEEHDPEKWYFHGYVVMAERFDTRITIEGIGSYEPLGKDELIDFLQMYRLADELDAEKDKPVYCWYD